MVALAVLIGLGSTVRPYTDVDFAVVAGFAIVLLIVVLLLIVDPGTVTLLVALLVEMGRQKK